MRLLLVESPAKCRKITEYLGDGWQVLATMGHIRHLKEELAALGFDAHRDGPQEWAPSYEIISDKKDTVARLRAAAKSAEAVYLGSDDDREGEAIAWHTCAILGLNPATTPRVVFHEITAPVLRAAVASPRRIDLNKFNAQQARTMLDLLIGFTLSPCLWRSLGANKKNPLSAGRCQTPALRLVYDRDRSIESHTGTLSWQIAATTAAMSWTGPSVPDEAAAVAGLNTIVGSTLTVLNRTERVAIHAHPLP